MSSVKYHKLLLRQIRKVYKDEMPDEVIPLLQLVNKAYYEFDEERAFIERSMDISSKELIEINENLKTQSDKLLRMNAELDDFAFAVSHDLREPLRSVGSFSQLVEEKLKNVSDTETQTFFGYVKLGVKRMDAMLAGMAVYAGIQSDVNRVPVDLNDVITNVLSQFSEIERAEAIFNIPFMPVIKGNKNHLTMLFYNVLLNAIIYKGTKPLIIDIMWFRKDKLIEFIVKDNGLGINDIDRNKYLKIFRKANSLHQGAGMGLAICKKIVINHGGTIEIDKNANAEGLTVRFTIAV